MSNQNKLPVSVIILAPTLESLSLIQKKQLHRAIKSADFASEVTVIHHEHPIHDFATARNMALKQAKNAWVFFLDSDEWFGENAQLAITKLLSQAHVAGMTIRRLDIFHNKLLRHGETGQHHLLRFMRKDRSYFIRPVHEQALVDGVVQSGELTIWHESHTNVSQFWMSITRYAELEAEYRIQALPHTPKAAIMLQLLLYPSAKFFVNFIWKAGFLDGWQGLVYATLMSCHSLLTRIFWLEKIMLVTKK